MWYEEDVYWSSSIDTELKHHNTAGFTDRYLSKKYAGELCNKYKVPLLDLTE